MGRDSADERALGGISLMLNVLDELEEWKDQLTTIGTGLDSTDLTGHVQRISAIIGTAGDRRTNKRLISALSELHLEITDEFPHMPTIEYLIHMVMKRFYEAVGAHYENWEEIRQMTIAKALGSHAVLNESRLFRPSYFRDKKKRQKRRLFDRKKEPMYLDDMTGEDDEDYDEDDEDYDDNEDLLD